MILYGIPNCATVKKAREWLNRHDIAVGFHDFKKQGLDAALAQNWLVQTSWDRLVNRSGLTWRGLPEERKKQVCDVASALALILEKPGVVRRPLLVRDGRLLHVGFDAAAYAAIFNLERPQRNV